jgi:hypothetical protein
MVILPVYGMSSDVSGGASYLASQQDKAELAFCSTFNNQTVEWKFWQATNSELSSE